MNRGLSFALILLLCITMLARPARPVHAQGAAAANVSIVIVLDNSGSMGPDQQTHDPGNDPENLRFAAAQMFVKLLDVGDKVGLVVFADDASDSSPALVPITKEQDKDDFLPALHDRTAGGYTNMHDAFQRAGQLLAGDTSGNAKYILFLTDGQPEIAGETKGSPDFDQWWQETLQFVAAANAPVLAIALTPDANTPYLNDVTTRSGGKIFPATSNKQLAAAYLAVFGHLKNRTVLPIGGTSTSGEYHYTVPSSVRRAFFVVVDTQADPPPVTVGGNPVQAQQWFAKRFRLVTAPTPGDWAFRLNAPADDVRIILISRLEIGVVSPGGTLVPAGRPFLLAAYLRENHDDGTSVHLPAESFEVEVTRPGAAPDKVALNDAGKNGDERAADLVYSSLYGATDKTGQYTLAFTAYRGGIPVMATASALSANLE